MSRKIFVLDNKLSIMDDEIDGILEKTVRIIMYYQNIKYKRNELKPLF